MEQDNKEICTIRIMFPVESDEQALNAKKQIAEALKDIEGVQVHFAIMPPPTRPPIG